MNAIFALAQHRHQGIVSAQRFLRAVHPDGADHAGDGVGHDLFNDDQIVGYLKEICLLLIWVAALVMAVGTTARQIPAEARKTAPSFRCWPSR